MSGKLIIISAPSGSGKSTIIKAVMERGLVSMEFSVSATNRPPRPGEIDGVNYHFLSEEEFQKHIRNNDFVEFEEVYPGRFYGTLKSEIDDRLRGGKNVILDIDVKGAINVKKSYPTDSLSIFIEPPTVEALRMRLERRGTETAESLTQRVNRAEYEMSFAKEFDYVVINDTLADAVDETERIIHNFLK